MTIQTDQPTNGRVRFYMQLAMRSKHVNNSVLVRTIPSDQPRARFGHKFLNAKCSKRN